MYVFAGLAKLNADWLLHGLPLRMWLPARSDLAIVGPWLDEPWLALALQLGRRGVRLPDRAGAVLEADPAVRVVRDRRVPRRDVAAVPDRRVPVGDDRGVDRVLRARAGPRGCCVRRPANRAASPVPAPRRDAGRAARRCPRWCRRGRAWSGSRCRSRSRCATTSSRATTAGPTRATASRGWCCSPRRAATSASASRDTATGRTWIETARGSLHAAQWRMMATEPELIRQAAHAIADTPRPLLGQRGRGARRRVRLAQRTAGARVSSIPHVDLARTVAAAPTLDPPVPTSSPVI